MEKIVNGVQQKSHHRLMDSNGDPPLTPSRVQSDRKQNGFRDDATWAGGSASDPRPPSKEGLTGTCRRRAFARRRKSRRGAIRRTDSWPLDRRRASWPTPRTAAPWSTSLRPTSPAGAAPNRTGAQKEMRTRTPGPHPFSWSQQVENERIDLFALSSISRWAHGGIIWLRIGGKLPCYEMKRKHRKTCKIHSHICGV